MGCHEKDFVERKIKDLSEKSILTAKQYEAFKEHVEFFKTSCSNILKSSILIEEKIAQIIQIKEKTQSKKKSMKDVVKFIKALTIPKKKAEDNNDIDLQKQIQELILNFEELSIRTNDHFEDALGDMKQAMKMDTENEKK